MLFLYNIFIHIYSFAIRLVSYKNQKAAEWISGRKDLFTRLEEQILPEDRIIWMHCASAGELEQGKPVAEALKNVFPHHKLLVSFFSPSGYRAGKKWNLADVVTYLPGDTYKNAARFVTVSRPELVVFVKYEYWYHHLAAIRSRNIPLLMVSAIFRDNAAFFKWYGGFFRKMLRQFTQIFVQDAASLERLKAAGITNVLIGGDTRFDRVASIAGQASPVSLVQKFCSAGRVVVAGSTWPQDETLLASLLPAKGMRFVIAPHEITEAHLGHIETLFPKSIRFSKADEQTIEQAETLIIDNVGMLSKLYQYATIAYIGGGFNRSGIHNTLEAAVWSKPVLFGPTYQKFREARGLIEKEAAFSVDSPERLRKITDRLLHDSEAYKKSAAAAGEYVKENKGATERIMRYIQENRLLTS